MVFTKYNTAAEFSTDTLSILKKYEIQNNLLLGNIGDGENKTMLSVKDDNGKVIITAIRTSPFPMVIFETDNIRNDKAVEYLAKTAVVNGINIDYIMTEKAMAKSFAGYYGDLTGKTFTKTESLVLYIIDNVNDLPKIKGHFRAAQEKDMFFLPYWSADFPPACAIGEYDLAAGIERTRKMISDNSLYIWEDDYPVSMAAAVRKITDCRFVGQVYTPPQFRGKGYSTACVAALTRKLLDDGYKYIALYADCSNPYSNSVYRRIGYKEVYWYDQYKIRE